MEQSLLTILPNLSIGVISVLSLVYVTLNFNKTLESRSQRYDVTMTEQNNALREVEKEVRTSILEQLAKNSEVMKETSKTLERVMFHLDKK